LGRRLHHYNAASVLSADGAITNGSDKKKVDAKKAFSSMITFIGLHLMSYVDLLEDIKNTYEAWRKT